MPLHWKLLVVSYFTTTTTSLIHCNAYSPTPNSLVKIGNRRAFLHNGITSASTTAAAIAATTTLAPPPAHAAESPLSLGKPAPEFSLFNTKGEIITLDSLVVATPTPNKSSKEGKSNKEGKSGKWTVLYFYPGAFTSGCTLEARKFQQDLGMYQALNAQIVGVSVDAAQKQDEFCKSEGLDFFMLSDVGGKVSKAYGTSLSIPGFGTFSNRQTYIVDPQKNIRWVFADVDSHIPRHSTEVLDKLRELQHIA